MPLVELLLTVQETAERMPSTFGECQRLGYGDKRPCPWYGCRHHLGLDERAGKLTLAFPHLEPSRHHTCSIVAARKPRTMEEIARILNCSLAYVEKTMRSASEKFRAALGDEVDVERIGEGPMPDEW